MIVDTNSSNIEKLYIDYYIFRVILGLESVY